MSRHEETLRDSIDRCVYKVIGESDNNITTIAINCINKGVPKEKLTDKLYPLIGSSRKAEKLTSYLLDLVPLGRREKSDKMDEDDVLFGSLPPKKMKTEEGTTSAPDQMLSPAQIKDMMANAAKMIDERKRQLTSLAPRDVPTIPGLDVRGPPSVPLSTFGQPRGVTPAAQLGGQDAAERMRLLQENIQKRMAQMAGSGGKEAAGKPVPLILDARGQTVDKAGQVITLAQRIPTLIANKRAAKRETTKQTVKDVKPEETAPAESSTAQFFDNRIGRGPSATRTKRKFEFHEQGKFESMAARMRAKQQLEKLQAEIAAAAKKTGIQSSVKLALIQPKKELSVDEIPDVEWWDQVILKSDRYPTSDELTDEHLEGITHLVEHPAQLQPPVGERKVILPLHLTKRERKKLRRQNRREAWKDKQEKIRLGLEPPPEPKVRLANMMRALGQDAVQDPTKVEAHVRAQMAKRQKAHEEANAARKLTADQKRDKKAKKIKEDTTEEVHVAVYRVRDLNVPAKKFKVEANATQLFMTGLVILNRDCNVVVVEGGPKQQKKFKQLMTRRIKWEDDLVPVTPGSKEKVPNQCALVWEGTTRSRSFNDVRFKVAPSEALAREFFRKQGVAQYWDLAYSSTVLDNTDDD